MSHTHVSSFFHFFWSTKDRQPYISEKLKPRLYGFISGIVRNYGGKVLSYGGTDDHIHLLCFTPPNVSNSILIKETKARSSAWIHHEFSDLKTFKWEKGFGSISVSTSKIDHFKKFIETQEKFHQGKTFKDELILILKQNNIEYHPDYFLENTHSKQLFHIIWSTKEREKAFTNDLQKELYSYIRGIISYKKCESIAIGGMSDHLHILVDIPPKLALADFVHSIKTETSTWLNHVKTRGKFLWQPGYGAFSVSSSLVPTIVEYILNQEEHHMGYNFDAEWNNLVSSACGVPLGRNF